MDKKTDVRDQDEKVVEIEMERLRAFPNHPFKVIGDSQMTVSYTHLPAAVDFWLLAFLDFLQELFDGLFKDLLT